MRPIAPLWTRREQKDRRADVVKLAGSTLLTNAASLIAGRLLLSAGRFATGLVVARVAGPETYGAYAIVIGMMFVCEWLSDFGQTDIAVRDASGSQGVDTLQSLARLKLVFGPASAILLVVLLYAARYPVDMLLAGLAGCVSVLLVAFIQPMRARLKLQGRQYVDVGAEVAGLVASIPLLILLLLEGAPLWTLVAAFAAGRLLQALLTWRWTADVPTQASGAPMRPLALAALPLGILGLIVLVYEMAAPVVLSKLAGMTQTGQFMAAFRIVAPTIIIAQTVAQAFFPLLSAQWKHKSGTFLRSQETVIFVAAFLSSGMAAAAFGGAETLMGLFGSEFAERAELLKIFAPVVFLRAITAVVAPVVVIAERQSAALWLAGSALLLQVALLILLVPRLGLVGAAIGYLVVELLVSTVGTWLFASHAARCRFDATIPIRFALALLAAFATYHLIDASGSLAGLVLCPAIMIIFAALLGLMKPDRLRDFKSVLQMRAAAI